MLGWMRAIDLTLTFSLIIYVHMFLSEPPRSHDRCHQDAALQPQGDGRHHPGTAHGAGGRARLRWVSMTVLPPPHLALPLRRDILQDAEGL